MLSSSLYPSGLPDPVTDPGFYEGVNVKRLIAFLIDVCVIFLISFGFMAMFGLVTLGLGLLLTGPLVFAIALAYRTLLLGTASGTLGMQFMGLEFRTIRGETFDLGHAFLHSLAFTIIFSTGIGQVLSVGAMLATPKKSGLPDLLLGSALINRMS